MIFCLILNVYEIFDLKDNEIVINLFMNKCCFLIIFSVIVVIVFVKKNIFVNKIFFNFVI